MSEAETLRAAIEAALRRRDPDAEVSVERNTTALGNVYCVASSVVDVAHLIGNGSTEAGSLRSLALAAGLRTDGSDPAAEVEWLTAEVRRLRTDNARLDDVTRGALDDLAKVRAERDDHARTLAEIAEERRRTRDAIAAEIPDDPALWTSADVAHALRLAREELDAARAALRQYAPRCECGALATRTVGYDDCEPSTLRRVCDREACGRGLPVSGESAHAAAVRAAVER